MEGFTSVQQKVTLESEDALMPLCVALTPLSFRPWNGCDKNQPVFLVAMLEEKLSSLVIHTHTHTPPI